MEQRDLDAIIRGIAPAIKAFVSQSVAVLDERIAVLEKREPVVVKEVQQEPPSLDEFRRDFALILAESRAAIVEQRFENANLQAQAKAGIDAGLARIADAQTAIKSDGYVERAIEQATAPLLAKIAAVEAREPVIVEKMIPEQPRLDEFRHEFGAFMAECRADAAEQKSAVVEARAQLPDPAELRMAVENIALEGKAALGEVRGQFAETVTHLHERAETEIARVAVALALVKDGAPGRDGKDGKDGVDGPQGKPGEPGRDAEPITLEQITTAVLAIPETVDAAVANYLAANPPAAGLPGRDGTDGAPGRDGVDGLAGADGKSITLDDVLPVIEASIEQKMAALPVPKDGRDGTDGKDGKDADPEITKALIVNEVDRRITALPHPQDGRDGRDGKDADWQAIESRIDLVAERKFAEFPAPKDGAPGRDGADGKDGRDGADGKSIDLAEVAPLIEETIDLRVKALPVPQNGRDGADGKDGRDGASIEDAFIGRDGELILVFDKGRTKNLGVGFAEGINADALTQMVSEAAVRLYKGLWEPGQYKKGAWVTYGGSLFVAQSDTGERPTNSDDWRLALKRGRDGKDAETPKPSRPSIALPPKDED
jgi:hypothetical protein